MQDLLQQNIIVPLDVPENKKEEYMKNYETATHGSGKLMLFAGDQKVEHLNDDFYGKDIDPHNNDPEHLFKIASQAHIGLFATQLGFVMRYGMDYSDIPYLIKLNSKTNLVKTDEQEPLSTEWYLMKDIIQLKRNNPTISILSVGYTIYLGSEFEATMLQEAAQIIKEAHAEGLLTVIWMYPRGKAVPNEKDPHILAGATGVAAALGTDFVKINHPKLENNDSAKLLHEAVQAAGRTKVICAGGEDMDSKLFLQTLYDQIHIGGVMGNATGRNIHHKPLDEAIRFANAIFAITVENKSVEEAIEIYKDS